MYTVRPLAFALLIGAAACGSAEVPATDTTVRSGPARISETFISAFKEADNIDSPAIYHGTDDTHWVIATAKATHTLVVFDAVTGAEIRRVGRRGRGAGELNRPNGILVVDDSLLLVVERDNRRVQGFHLPSFRALGSFGAEQLRNPYGLTAFASEGGWRVYVTDNYETPQETVPPLAELNERVKWYQVRMENGRLRATFGGAFGDTTAAGALLITESILADPDNDRLMIAEETETDSYLKVYTLDGRYAGESLGRGYFPQQAEGIALYRCGTDAGYWVATDQGPVVNTFHLFDRMTLEHVASFAAARTNTTDGIVLTQRAFGPFPAGAFYTAHGDAAISALSWAAIAEGTGARQDCSLPR